MFFRDLSPYSYIPRHHTENALNVGWLSSEYSFPVGSTSLEFRQGLSELATEPVNLCAGSHDCEFCSPSITGFFFWRRRPAKSHSVPRGNGEIRVPAAHGNTIYVAPQLVAHYVEAHNYLPPPEFVEAVKVFAHERRLAWEALRAQWKERFPPLDGEWTHWRLFSYSHLIMVASRDELARAVKEVERFYRADLAVGVSRSFISPGADGVVVEATRHGVSEGEQDLPQQLMDMFVEGMRITELSES